MEIKSGDVYQFDGACYVLLRDAKHYTREGVFIAVWLNTPPVAVRVEGDYPGTDKYIGNIAGNLTALNSKLLELGE